MSIALFIFTFIEGKSYFVSNVIAPQPPFFKLQCKLHQGHAV